MGKLKAMKLSKYFEIQKCEYVYIELTPVKSDKNNKTSDIARVINQLYKSINQRISKDENKLIIKTNQKASYYIHITKNKVRFFFIVPKVHLNIFKTKLSEVWKHIKIEEVKEIPIIENEQTYSLKYTRKDILSLSTDKRSNELLNANMSILEILEEDEEVGIFYNFIPTGEKENRAFRYEYNVLIKKYKEGDGLKNSISIKSVLIKILKETISFIDSVLCNKQTTFVENANELSSSTKSKAKQEICKTQILLTAKSNDKDNKKLIKSVSNTFNSIGGNNALELKKVNLKSKIDIESPKMNTPILNTSIDEVGEFISLPGRELIEQYRGINHLTIAENPIPKCLQDGNFFLGLVNYKNKVMNAYFSTHKEYQNLERVLIGSKGSGKSYRMIKWAKNAEQLNRGVIVIDIIEDCKLSKDIAKNTPKDKLIEIKCNKLEGIQSFSYNEIPINKGMSPYEIYTNSVKRTQQLQVLLDAINDDSSKLSPRMMRYLYAAGAIVYSVMPNASLNNILECLENHKTRHEFINNLTPELSKLLDKRIKKICELDVLNKNNEPNGNNDTKIAGILDRMALLDSVSSHMEVAISKTCENNINFVDAIRENKVVLIEIPEEDFPSQMVRNVMATFFLSKVWLAKQILASEDYQPTTELYFDEFYKCYNAQLLFEIIFAEARKYRLISTVAIHSLNQLSNKCRMTLKSGGASYLLLSGSDVQAYKDLHSYFDKFGYDEQTLQELKQYTALCLIKNEDTNYSAFIAKLPA